MRRLISIAAVAALSLLLAGVALASFTQTSHITFTGGKAAKSTGIKADIHSATSPGRAPKAATKLVVTFPAGTRFNLGVVKRCTLSDTKVLAGRACPAASQIGTGSATASAFPLPQRITAGVKAYVTGKSRMLLVVKATSPIRQTLVIHVTVSGPKLLIPVPSPSVSGFKVVLVSLKLNVPARGRGHGTLITAGKCTAHQFLYRSHFLYSDGSTKDVQSTSRCS